MGERALFSGGGDFHREIRRRVADALPASRVRRGRWSAALKSAILGVWAIGSYLALLLVAHHAWQVVPLGISLAVALAGVGFSVGHDANHDALFGARRVNRVLGFSFDLIGASSYVWRTKHNTAHHSFTNVVGADDDIDQMPLARFAPDQPRRVYHRFQHIYLWPLYGLFAIRHHLVGDFSSVLFGHQIGGLTTLPRPSRSELGVFFLGKLAFWTWALVIPLALHPWWAVLATFIGVSWIMGFIMATTFQLAHCVDEADFTTVEKLREGDATSWAAHQVESTVDFATGSRVLAWYLGGLNFQIEHHLFPRVCHVHYPHLLAIVRETCLEFDVRHVSQPTVRSALASHARWLRHMGSAASVSG